MCSVPCADFERRGASIADCVLFSCLSDCSKKALKSGRGSSSSMFRRSRPSREDDANEGGMSMVELMEQCRAVVEESFKGEYDVPPFQIT